MLGAPEVLGRSGIICPVAIVSFADVWFVGQVVVGWCRRCRGGDVVGGLRGRSGLSPSRRARSSGYTKEPLAPRTSSTDAPTGQSQRFVQGRDIPQEWWTLFKSPALNALIKRSLDNNPNLQSAIATLARGEQSGLRPRGSSTFRSRRPISIRRGSAPPPILRSVPASVRPTVFNLYTAQRPVSYTFDVWGLNRRTVESLEAHGRQCSASRSRRPI